MQDLPLPIASEAVRALCRDLGGKEWATAEFAAISLLSVREDFAMRHLVAPLQARAAAVEEALCVAELDASSASLGDIVGELHASSLALDVTTRRHARPSCSTAAQLAAAFTAMGQSAVAALQSDWLHQLDDARSAHAAPAPESSAVASSSAYEKSRAARLHGELAARLPRLLMSCLRALWHLLPEGRAADLAIAQLVLTTGQSDAVMANGQRSARQSSASLAKAVVCSETTATSAADATGEKLERPGEDEKTTLEAEDEDSWPRPPLPKEMLTLALQVSMLLTTAPYDQSRRALLSSLDAAGAIGVRILSSALRDATNGASSLFAAWVSMATAELHRLRQREAVLAQSGGATTGRPTSARPASGSASRPTSGGQGRRAAADEGQRASERRRMEIELRSCELAIAEARRCDVASFAVRMLRCCEHRHAARARQHGADAAATHAAERVLVAALELVRGLATPQPARPLVSSSATPTPPPLTPSSPPPPMPPPSRLAAELDSREWSGQLTFADEGHRAQAAWRNAPPSPPNRHPELVARIYVLACGRAAPRPIFEGAPPLLSYQEDASAQQPMRQAAWSALGSLLVPAAKASASTQPSPPGLAAAAARPTQARSGTSASPPAVHAAVALLLRPSCRKHVRMRGMEWCCAYEAVEHQPSSQTTEAQWNDEWTDPNGEYACRWVLEAWMLAMHMLPSTPDACHVIRKGGVRTLLETHAALRQLSEPRNAALGDDGGPVERPVKLLPRHTVRTASSALLGALAALCARAGPSAVASVGLRELSATVALAWPETTRPAGRPLREIDHTARDVARQVLHSITKHALLAVCADMAMISASSQPTSPHLAPAAQSPPPDALLHAAGIESEVDQPGHTGWEAAMRRAESAAGELTKGRRASAATPDRSTPQAPVRDTVAILLALARSATNLEGSDSHDDGDTDDEEEAHSKWVTDVLATMNLSTSAPATRPAHASQQLCVWALEAVSELATTASMRPAIVIAGGLEVMCDLVESAGAATIVAEAQPAAEATATANGSSAAQAEGASGHRGSCTGFAKVLGRVEARSGAEAGGMHARPTRGADVEIKSSRSRYSSAGGPKARSSTDTGESSDKDGTASSRPPSAPSRPAALRSSMAGALRSLFRSLCFADAARHPESALLVGAPTLIYLCKLIGRANGGDSDEGDEPRTAAPVSAEALATAVAAAGKEGANTGLPPSDVIANAHVALSTLLLRCPSNCQALESALRAAAIRARSADVDSIAAATAGLSAMLSVSPDVRAIDGSGASGMMADMALSPLSPTASESERRTLLLMHALGETVAAHTVLHTFRGESQHAPLLDALPTACALLGSERPPILAASAQLVALLCATRSGRGALVTLQGSPLHSLSELISHDDATVRAAVLHVLVRLSEDPAACPALQRTAAVQGALDLIECERVQHPEATTDPSPSGPPLQVALQVLKNLVRHDGGLSGLLREHPAIEDLDLGWTAGPPQEQTAG